MIKFGIHPYIWTAQWNESSLPLISQARQAGFDFIEIPLVDLEYIETHAILQELKNQSQTVLEAAAREEAARVVAEGEREAVSIREAARNEILAQKARLIEKFGDAAASLLFLDQKLPGLLEAWKAAQSASGKFDTIVAMDEDAASVANRGPRAFAEFLRTLRDALGIDVRTLASPSTAEAKGGAK